MHIDLPILRQYCLMLLARRDYSVWELSQKLTAKGGEPEQIQAILALCIDKGWQSDARFAENYSQYRANKGVGPRKLAYELQQRGVDATLIDEALNAHAWKAQASRARIKRFGKALPSSPDARAKQMRFLMQRGFPMPLIKTVLTEPVEYEYDSK